MNWWVASFPSRCAFDAAECRLTFLACTGVLACMTEVDIFRCFRRLWLVKALDFPCALNVCCVDLCRACFTESTHLRIKLLISHSTRTRYIPRSSSSRDQGTPCDTRFRLCSWVTRVRLTECRRFVPFRSRRFVELRFCKDGLGVVDVCE